MRPLPQFWQPLLQPVSTSITPVVVTQHETQTLPGLPYIILAVAYTEVKILISIICMSGGKQASYYDVIKLNGSGMVVHGA